MVALTVVTLLFVAAGLAILFVRRKRKANRTSMHIVVNVQPVSLLLVHKLFCEPEHLLVVAQILGERSEIIKGEDCKF